jgi:hypothetical protein
MATEMFGALLHMSQLGAHVDFLCIVPTLGSPLKRKQIATETFGALL